MPEDGIGRFVVVEAALADTPLEPSPTWTNYGAYVEGATSTGGRGSVFDRYKASTLDVGFNNQDLGIGPPLATGVWQRWKQVRMRTVADDTLLAHGHIEETPHDLGSEFGKDSADLNCVDGIGLIARRELNEEAVPAGSTTSVITYLAGLAGLPAPTFVGMSSIPIARIPAASGNVLSVLQDVLDTESGYIVHQPQDAPLTLEVRGRYAPLIAWSSYIADGPKCRFFGDPDPDGIGEVGILRGPFMLSAADETYRDDVTGMGTREHPFHQSNTPADFPPSSLSRTEMLTANDNWVISSVDMWLKIYGYTDIYPRSLKVLCATTAKELPALAIVKLLRYGDIVEVDVGGDVLPYPIENIRWELTRQGLWATFGFSFPGMATRYGPMSGFAQVGSGIVGTSKVAP